MDGIVKRPARSVQSSEDAINTPSTFCERMATTLRNISDEKSSVVLSTLMQGIEVGSDIANSIQRELVYLAKIPKHLEDGFGTGALTFMQKSDTGESLGAIVDANHLNRGFVRIEQGNPPGPNLLHSLSNLAMQQQLAYIAEMIGEVRSRVIALQEMHDSSLYGELRGMHQQLIQMKNAQNSETRKQLATCAITSLNKTRGKITQRLIDELRKLPDPPASRWKAVLKTLKTKGFFHSLTEGHDNIQKLFSYYLESTQLLAFAYAFLDEPQSYENIFFPDPALMQSAFMEKLVAAESYVNPIEDAWYKKPEEFLERISREVQRLFVEDQNVIEIEVTGIQLLEAIIDEQEN